MLAGCPLLDNDGRISPNIRGFLMARSYLQTFFFFFFAGSCEISQQVIRRGVIVNSALCKGFLPAGCCSLCKQGSSFISIDRNPVSFVTNAGFCLRRGALLRFTEALQEKEGSCFPKVTRESWGRAAAGTALQPPGLGLRLQAPSSQPCSRGGAQLAQRPACFGTQQGNGCDRVSRGRR